MIIKFKKISLLVGLISLFLYGTAFATYIDFRFPDPDPDNDNRVASGYSKSQDGVTVTIEAVGNEDLWWDGTDGFGIWGSGYEKDEIDSSEIMKVTFSSTVNVSYFDITDLFYENGYQEIGWYDFDGEFITDKMMFMQTDLSKTPSPASNGEFMLFINDSIQEIWFAAPGRVNGQNHEFSLAGVEIRSVPEPSTLALLGCALIVFAGLGRNRLKKK